MSMQRQLLMDLPWFSSWSTIHQYKLTRYIKASGIIL